MRCNGAQRHVPTSDQAVSRASIACARVDSDACTRCIGWAEPTTHARHALASCSVWSGAGLAAIEPRHGTEMTHRALVWHRQDLRVTDHAPLATASQRDAEVIALYVFDERQFLSTPAGFPKTGAFRAQFLRESVVALRERYRALGVELIVRRGRPERVIPSIVEELELGSVYFHTYPTHEELAVERAVVASLSVPCIGSWGHTLHAPEELPFEASALPEIFTQFRKRVEAECTVREPLVVAQRLRPVTQEIALGEVPRLEDLGLVAPQPDARAALAFEGGEAAGTARLCRYVWEQDLLKTYKDTRNGMIGPDYSSKLSPWLALGCLSPRQIFDEVKRYERERVENDSTYWLTFELLWRDYFAFIAAKHGARLFRSSGLRGIELPWKHDHERFDLWCRGETGFPLVDANMRELRATGFMSNRGRQNVASFLTKNLGIDWRWGAEWFESLLIDYDVSSNWGNWNYTAGVGNDARGFRYFNIQKQSRDYDLHGYYVKLWLPELAAVPADRVHEPSTLTSADQTRFGVRMGVDYPKPVVDLFESARTNKELYDAAT